MDSTGFADRQHSFSLITLALFSVGLVAYSLYRGVTGQLSHLPGPFLSRFTRLRLRISVLIGDRHTYVHRLHQRYGAVVRISPDEVSLSSPEAAKQIYKMGSHFAKASFYDLFNRGLPVASVFDERDVKKHATQRRLTAHHFSENWVKRMEPFISRNVQLTVLRMEQEVEKEGCCDVFKWFTFMATDIIGEASFGESFRMLETGQKNQYIHDLENIGATIALLSELPWLMPLLAWLPFGPGKELQRTIDRTSRYAEESLDRYWLQNRADPENVKPTLFTKEYAALESGTLSKTQLMVDARGNILAGTDTTAITATYAVYFVCQNPSVQSQLIREVDQLPQNFTDEDLKQLSTLSNVLNETLRLRGPISQALPRSVPIEGAQMGDYFIPGGITVGIPAWSIHRNPDVWPKPDEFDPSRWNEVTKNMKDSFYAFGGGSRVCLGMHFAQLELRHALANFYRQFGEGMQISERAGFVADIEMQPVSFFLMPPRGKRCLLERREKKSA